jgi:hypothetical protein
MSMTLSFTNHYLLATVTTSMSRVYTTRDEIKLIMKQRIAEKAFQAFNGISPE